MATKYSKVCDITGQDIAPDARAVILSVSGLDADGGVFDTRISLDLSDGEKEKLAKALLKYFKAGRDVGPVIVPAAKASTTNPETAKIRAWALAQPDITVNEKGRVPQAVIDKYYEVHADEKPAAPQEGDDN